MGYPSTLEANFQETVARWLEQNGEILVLFRYSHMAGSREYELITTQQDWQERLAQAPPRTCISVWGDRQLPLRGRVDAAFIQQALRQISEEDEFLVVGLTQVSYGIAAWYRHTGGEGHAELRTALQNFAGELVAVGIAPAWSEDGGNEMSAVVPDEKGNATPGVY